MKIFKGKYGWSTTAHSQTREGEKIRNFVDCQFQKGNEPIGEEIEGDLIFRGKDGVERNCFFSSYLKQGEPIAKLVLMGKPKQVQQTLTGDMRSVDGHLDKTYDPNLVIDDSELPFF